MRILVRLAPNRWGASIRRNVRGPRPMQARCDSRRRMVPDACGRDPRRCRGGRRSGPDRVGASTANDALMPSTLARHEADSQASARRHVEIRRASLRRPVPRGAPQSCSTAASRRRRDVGAAPRWWRSVHAGRATTPGVGAREGRRPGEGIGERRLDAPPRRRGGWRVGAGEAGGVSGPGTRDGAVRLRPTSVGVGLRALPTPEAIVPASLGLSRGLVVDVDSWSYIAIVPASLGLSRGGPPRGRVAACQAPGPGGRRACHPGLRLAACHAPRARRSACLSPRGRAWRRAMHPGLGGRRACHPGVERGGVPVMRGHPDLRGAVSPRRRLDRRHPSLRARCRTGRRWRRWWHASRVALHRRPAGRLVHARRGWPEQDQGSIAPAHPAIDPARIRSVGGPGLHRAVGPSFSRSRGPTMKRGSGAPRRRQPPAGSAGGAPARGPGDPSPAADLRAHDSRSGGLGPTARRGSRGSGHGAWRPRRRAGGAGSAAVDAP